MVSNGSAETQEAVLTAVTASWHRWLLNVSPYRLAEIEPQWARVKEVKSRTTGSRGGQLIIEALCRTRAEAR